MTNNGATVYTIPPRYSFADALAYGLLEQEKETPERLASYLILLPTRRACRIVRDAFLRCTNGKPLLLPRLQPVGDIDEDELRISAITQSAFDLPPAISPMRRTILLAQIIGRLPGFSKGPAQDLGLANSLGQLLDQIYTEDLDIGQLAMLVDREKFARHWQITLDFLSILTIHWPKILAEEMVIDAADRRNRLIKILTAHWAENNPTHPIIAAGSTGSIPSTRGLLKTIAHLTTGSIILPALDHYMNEDAWQGIEQNHPQSTIKELIEYIEIDRHDVQLWPYCETAKTTREKLISDVMLPANHTGQWRALINEQNKEKSYIENIYRFDCENTQEEASLIAIALRETLKGTGKTAALITPDRQLAKRVTAICQKWDIDIDDSAGIPLSETPIGSFIRLSAECCLDNLSPASLLCFLKHSLSSNAQFDNYRKTVRLLDKDILRGLKPIGGFIGLRLRHQEIVDDLYKKDPDPIVIKFIHFLEDQMEKFLTLIQKPDLMFDEVLQEHLILLEKFCDPKILWGGDDGEAASIFLSSLKEDIALLPPVTGHDYITILNDLMKGVTVRPRYGTHPRLMILGQLEARLLHTDRVILSGLNEGTWPSDQGHDPWMSRPMRDDFGLPSSEKSIGLSAHDFVQGFCAPEVFLTRSNRDEGTPTVPSRWLQRLDTVAHAMNLKIHTQHSTQYGAYLNAVNSEAETIPVLRPSPRPPLKARPSKLSVTRIETWLKDPYAIYAYKILKLNKIDPLEKPWSALEKGNVLHKILERFTQKHKTNLGFDDIKSFISIAEEECLKTNQVLLWQSWAPRLRRIGEWLINHEINWRDTARPYQFEIKGGHVFNFETPFTLEGRADRIDISPLGHYAIIDYKSGGQFSITGMINGKTPQLPLEAVILEQGGFNQYGLNGSVFNLSYWQLSGGETAGDVTTLKDPKKLQEAKENALIGLENLVKAFNDQKTPYLSIPRTDNLPRFNDYEHLARIKEWTALGDSEDVA
ncbi:MAG: double-strand break repair protein AddB [Alphaproteobacteria bacterium]|nr:double-strand break repair protein AddB [Alphaproteobacteria bacterium]NCQ88554.1 double-strand break repair protein AddB [Alphaproteobacteria bacterium]NCT06097.1 double-strand break repair protein AddB [Alphaproteobacteria bacterium]